MIRPYLIAVMVAAVAALLAPASVRADELYRSDLLGIEMEAVSPDQVSQTEWLLQVHREGTSEIRTLTHSGKETKRWVDEFEHGQLAKETLYDAGVISSVTVYRDGHPQEEENYLDGKFESKRIYRYEQGLLARIEVEGSDGSPDYRTVIYRDPDGRLRRAVRTYPDGRAVESAYTYTGGSLLAEWHGNDRKGELIRYSGSDLAAIEDWEGGAIINQTDFAPDGKGQRSVETDFASGAVTRRLYDAKGKLLSEQVSSKDATVSRTDFRYEGDRLVDKVVLTPGVREESRYAYGRDGKLARVEVTRNLTIVKVTVYTGDDSSYEELYTNGKPFLRVYYKDGNKVREEVVTG